MFRLAVLNSILAILSGCLSFDPSGTRFEYSDSVDSTAADGSPVDVLFHDSSPTDASQIDSADDIRKLVFISSQLHTPDFGGIGGADAFCNHLAQQAALSGQFKAWLSNSYSSPHNRFTHATLPYYLVNGTLVANDWADLVDGDLHSPIDVTETGGTPLEDTLSDCGMQWARPRVWSSTTSQGHAIDAIDTPEHSCGAWGETPPSKTSSLGIGTTQSSSSEWSDLGGCSDSCNSLAPIYCFQQ